MPRMDCESVRDSLDAWALGALDADEARALEAHIATCADCARLADDARDAAASVAFAAPLVNSSAALKSRVMASAAVLTDIAGPARSRWWQGAALRQAAAAALVLFAVGSVAWGALMQQRVGDLEDRNTTISAGATAQADQLASVRSQLVSASSSTQQLEETVATQNVVLDVALEPDVQRTDLAGTPMAPAAKGRCLWSRAQALGAFVAENLAAPTEGMVYRMWLVYERDWVDGGSFDVDDDGRGRLVMRRIWDGGDHGDFLGFAVTLEPAGRTAERTGALVMQSPLE